MYYDVEHCLEPHSSLLEDTKSYNLCSRCTGQWEKWWKCQSSCWETWSAGPRCKSSSETSSAPSSCNMMSYRNMYTKGQSRVWLYCWWQLLWDKKSTVRSCTSCQEICCYVCVYERACVHLCVCIYTHECVHLCVYVYECAHLCVYVYECVHVCICVYVYECVHMCICVCMYMSVCMCASVCVCIRVCASVCALMHVPLGRAAE